MPLYVINFTSAANPGANTSGAFDDSKDVTQATSDLADYFRSGGLAVAALNVSDWTSMDVVVNGNTYTYSR